VTETRVVVRADLAVRYSSRLSRMATELVLPAARRERDATNTSAQQRQIARERMAQCVAHRLWLSRTIAETDPEAKAETVALEEAGGKCLVVLGALQQGEAEELARAARLTGHWSPQRHGDTVLSCGRQKVQLAAESAAADPLHALERFVIGFLRQVAISDLHLGVKGRDTFGAHKEPALVRLLDEVIEQRATLILNGDFLELMHESYGAIKRSYPEVFARLARVRRIIYVPGNHDQEVLRDRIKEVRRSTRRRAARHAYASVRRDESGGIRVEPRPWALLHPRLQAWRDTLVDPRAARWLEEVLAARYGSIHLSHGFAEEGVAFQRAGPRDTPEERPVWYLDDSMLRERDPAARMLKLVADRRQRLDRVIGAEWGGRVRIAPYHFDPARGLYFEHGHAAVPSCNGSWLGPAISRLGGWLKRCGVTRIEHLVEERIGRHVRAIYPFGRVREMNQFIERALAVATWLVHGEKISNPALFFGHTHEPAAAAADPVHAFTTRLAGASYGNTGAWSSRLRAGRAGDNLVEWLEADASGRVQARAEHVWNRMKPGAVDRCH
jgi:predicted phosphodiesterase